MAIVTISTNKFNLLFNATTLALAAGDTLNVLPNVGIFDFGGGTSKAVAAAGGNSFVLDGDIMSYGTAGLDVAAGSNDINIGTASTVYGQTNHHQWHPQGAIAGERFPVLSDGRVAPRVDSCIPPTGPDPQERHLWHTGGQRPPRRRAG